MDGGAHRRAVAEGGEQWGYSTRLDNPLPGTRRPWPAPDPHAPDPHAPDPNTPDPHAPKPGRTAPDETSPDEPAGQHGAEASGTPPMPRWKKRLYWAVGLLILAALAIAGLLYYRHAQHYESTDDAFIDGNISQISAQVPGRVTRIAFTDNQDVTAGQLLLELDPRDYQVRLDQARAQRAQAAAQMDQAQAQINLLQANLDQAAANVRVTEADLSQAQADLGRFRAIDPKAITRQQLDTANAAARSAQAKLDANRQAVAGVRAQIEAQRAAIAGSTATVRQAEVAVANAELQLSYTRIVSPVAGQVTKRTTGAGNYANPGQSLLAVVQQGLWVTANFKETQLAEMRPGQPVRVRVDACPDLDLEARVASFQAGSGAVFSSLPAENATGNYVKVVQRVPVRIMFEDQDTSRCRMAPGMSVTPRVTVR